MFQRRTNHHHYLRRTKRWVIAIIVLSIWLRFIASSHQLLITSNTTEISMDYPTTKQPSILLYITTHFSDQHIRYFHCCWPILVKQSPLISSAHVLIAATNTSQVSLQELEFLENLFSKNPSYQFRYQTNNTNCDKYKNATKRFHRNPLKVPVNLKQCLANQGVQIGIENRWMFAHDWVIRINPDVMIRKSSWLLETMSNSSMEGIFVYCHARQLHTDFFAVRPSSLKPDAFRKMAIKANKLNHERTAYREFKHLVEDPDKHRLLPDVEESQGSCRVRGNNASVYHVHDSCIANNDNDPLICNSLQGWDLSK